MKRHRLIIICALAALSAQAQEQLSTSVTIDRTVVPEQRAASRLKGFVPGIYTPEIKASILLPAEYAGTAEVVPGFVALDPAVHPRAAEASNQRGYAALGYMPMYNLAASAGYRFVDNPTTTLGAWLQFDGRLWHGKGYDVERALYRNNTLTVAAYGSHKFDSRSTLAVDASYTRAQLTEPNYMWHPKQGINIGSARVGWQSRVARVDYEASMQWHGFGFNTLVDQDIRNEQYDERVSAPSEQRLEFAGKMRLPLSEELHFGALIDAGYQHWHLLETFNFGLFGLTPYLGFEKGQFAGHAGLKMQVSTGGSDRTLHFAPYISVGWMPSSVFSVSLDAEGGNAFSTLQSCYNYTAWLPASFVSERHFVPIDASLKMAIGPFRGFSAALIGRYAYAQWVGMPLHVTTSKFDYDSFAPTNISGLMGGLELRYNPSALVNVYAGALFAPQNLDRGYYRWMDRAKAVVTAGVESRPIKPLALGVDYELRSGRATSYLNQEMELAPLGSVSNLKAHAQWQFNEHFSIFLTGENLLNHRYDILYGLPAQGITGLLGATYKF